MTNPTVNRSKLPWLVAVIMAAVVAAYFFRAQSDHTNVQSMNVPGDPIGELNAKPPSESIADRDAPTIAGMVQSAAGEKISGATVSFIQGDRTFAEVLTGSNGEFAAKTPLGGFAVKAQAKGFGATIVHTVAPTIDVNITLFPGNAVSGLVLLEDSRRTVPNVRVVATTTANQTFQALRSKSVQANARGEFRFDDLTAGAWLLTVDGPGVYGESREPIRVGLDDEVRDITLLVKPATELSGRFTVERDEPCRAGHIQFISQSAVRKSRVAPHGTTEATEEPTEKIIAQRVDGSGHFEIHALPHGDYLVSPECTEHRYVSGPTTIHVDERPSEPLRYKFSAGSTVSTTVRDQSGRAVALAAVKLEAANESSLTPVQIALAQRSGFTDEQGVYRFGGLRAGLYRVSARYSAINGKVEVEQVVDVQDEANARVDLTLAGAGSIRIHSRTASGSALSRLLFFAIDDKKTRYEARYRGDGRFEIGPLPRDSYRVFAYDNKNAKVALQGGSSIAVRDDAGVDLEFEYQVPDAVLEGRVIDSTGTPLPGTLVRAVSATLDEVDEMYSFIQTGAHGPQELMTDRSGRFRISGLDARAAFDLYIDHPAGLQEVRYGVRPGGFVDIALPAASRILGRVMDEQGKPVSKFDVLASNTRTGGSRSRSFVSAQGEFALDNVTPGEIAISIYDRSGDRDYDRSAQLAPGQALDLGVLVLSRH